LPSHTSRLAPKALSSGLPGQDKILSKISSNLCDCVIRVDKCAKHIELLSKRSRGEPPLREASDLSLLFDEFMDDISDVTEEALHFLTKANSYIETIIKKTSSHKFNYRLPFLKLSNIEKLTESVSATALAFYQTLCELNRMTYHGNPPRYQQELSDEIWRLNKIMESLSLLTESSAAISDSLSKGTLTLKMRHKMSHDYLPTIPGYEQNSEALTRLDTLTSIIIDDLIDDLDVANPYPGLALQATTCDSFLEYSFLEYRGH